MNTELKKIPTQIDAYIPDSVKEIPWPRVIAAGTLLAGACLLATGRHRAALGAALGAVGIAVLEKPEMAKEIWENAPKYLRSTQDFLKRAESVVEDLTGKGQKIRELLSEM
ncbi:MAG TPA: hypothetical protein VFW25_06315 [Silvibacterium sp.]|nr:hypothetical protein [Silvibacterium sp.]